MDGCLMFHRIWLVHYMSHSFWLTDGFVTGYNHLLKIRLRTQKHFRPIFSVLLTYAISLILAIVSEAIFWPPCSWADETIRRAYSESEEIIGSSSCPKTDIRLELDNLRLVTWVDPLTPSIALEKPSKLFSFPWENNRSIFGIVSLNNNSQALRKASELALVKHGYLFVKEALDK